jgi:regulator of CtrA degradation
MQQPANLNPRIIESLYAEGLMLSDAVRSAFDLSRRDESDPEDVARIALSCEALRTTTRMMHAVAWLLNHRAFLSGEISAFQLHRHGRIATNLAAADPARMELMPEETQALIVATERFYARLVRLDTGWREREAMPRPEIPAVQRLRERLSRAVR